MEDFIIKYGDKIILGVGIYLFIGLIAMVLDYMLKRNKKYTNAENISDKDKE